MYAASVASSRTVASHLRELAHMPSGRAAITISIKKDHHGLESTQTASSSAPEPYVHSYTSLDRIEGEVAITAPNALRFEDISITFEGTSRTYVENVSSASMLTQRTAARHNFLKLAQPIDQSSFPHPRILEPGRTYRFPFTFVIPERMLPSSCRHSTVNAELHEAHLQLPPSTGDAELAGDGTQRLDDQAPEMTRVSYAIKARITNVRESDNKNVVICEREKKVRVIPAVEENPPLDESRLVDYSLRRTKNIKKGLFKGTLGSLSIEAAQPSSLHLPARGLTADACATTTMASIQLRFDPAHEDSQPPALSQLVSRLTAESYYSSSAMRHWPTRDSLLNLATRGRYFETLPLASRCIASVQWEKFGPSDAPSRRDSALSTMSIHEIPAPSEAYTGGNFYVAKVLVPITLPKTKAFLPTFYSCIIARFYTLDLSVSYQSSATKFSAPTISVKLPIQISAAGDPAAQRAFSEANSQDAFALEVDDAAGALFEAGSLVAPPSPEYTRVSLVASSGTGTSAARESHHEADYPPPAYPIQGHVAFGNEKAVPIA
ncbi:hypothetical protein L228DRAFT_237261 [Xylona heveae TC161]|uniref:Bul1 N-terminal domain-containing protein n=1 Tax=Xylona heveae (strain CBS 132557 / TC161) TaxID=1328760 RepID=A0A165I3F8_XYLHT|nr:hypothetical protein L228DRAFT_237261 [Xylona heveae TC161]KZF24321.1 hypothetical protein L228DRAFT_237261 [Xylona heveae TC161]